MTLGNVAFAIALLFTGLPFVLGGLAFAWFRWRFLAGAVRTPGEVVDYRSETEESTEDGRAVRSAVFHPVVEFRDAQGVQRRCQTSTASSPPPFHIGARVTVLYRPADPAQAEIAAFQQLWLGPLMLLVLGLAQVAMAIALLLADKSIFT